METENEVINEETAEESQKEKSTITSADIFDWLGIVVGALTAVVIIFTFVFRVATIVGSSMENTLINNEKVIITDWFYTPQVGDIVVVSRNVDNTAADTGASPIIKRIIATEGQWVRIDFEKGIVYVDGVALDEPYIKEPTFRRDDLDYSVARPVPEGHVFCLGDNRNNSLDSRSSRIGNDGMIDKRYILGKAVFRILPFDKIGGVE